MVASASLTINAKPIEALKQGVDNVEGLVFTVAEKAVSTANDRNLPVIRQYPPRLAVLPFKFGSEKSRRWYFANKVPRGSRGGRYQRTGGLGKSWTVQSVKGQGAYRATLSSSMQGAVFVVGNLNRGRQVAGHGITGWQYVAPKIEDWQSDVLSEFFRLYEKQVGNLSEVRLQ